METHRRVLKLVGEEGNTVPVQIALKIKGIEYENVEVEPNYPTETLASPVLHDGDRSITGTINIIEYVDEVWKENPIMPEDPYERAVARQWCDFFTGKMASSGKLIFTTTGKEMAAGVEKVRRDLNEVEKELREGHFRGRRFFGGSKLGLLDIVFGGGYFYLSVVNDLANTTIIDPHLYPYYTAWLADFKEQDVVKSVPVPDHDTQVVHARKVKEAVLLSLKSGGAGGGGGGGGRVCSRPCKKALIAPVLILLLVLVLVILSAVLFLEKKKTCGFCSGGGGGPPLISITGKSGSGESSA